MKKSRKTTKQTNGLATKKDLKQLEKRMGLKYPSKDDIKKLEQRMDVKYASKNDIISFKDEILHEIKGLREE